MKVAIIQSSYIPWMGYFDIISRCDEFILMDDVQYTKRDWRNRNFIKTNGWIQMLSVPVVKGIRERKIEEVEISNPEFGLKHWKSIQQNYRKAPYFTKYAPVFEEIYSRSWTRLSELNRTLTEACCLCLEIKTPIKNSTDYGRFQGKNERLLELCKAAKADCYLSGPKAEAYLDEGLFNKEGISVEFMNYNYPPYKQLYGDFIPKLTVLDLLFNEGPNAMSIIQEGAIT